MLSYELPMGIMLVGAPADDTARLSLVRDRQHSPLPWYYRLWMLLIFPFFFITMLAETNRSPFDLPETENELVAGFQTEYGGIKFALFYMTEYLHMISASAVAVTLFFGGWRGPGVRAHARSWGWSTSRSRSWR